MLKILATLLVFASSAATAQTTNCVKDYFGNVTCTTQPTNQVDYGRLTNPSDVGRGVNDSFERGARMGAQMRRERELAEQRKDAKQHKKQSLEAAKMVTAGDCPGAQAYALGVGNFALAQQIKDYCAK